ncbi:fatty acyl-AMP ligase [Saccharothrix sp. Mg75]|uniref:fatty acyl-AMP ligase n=1 Tax=Saccharothrix sp. Mg75 TaxID=3445357 RepID=UPI003EEC00E6
MREWIRGGTGVAEVVLGHVERDPGALAVVDVLGSGPDGPSASWTYGELHQRAATVAAHLRERCAPGDRVMLLYPVNRHFVAAFLGCLYAGVAAVVVPPPGGSQVQRRRAGSVAADAGVRLALTDSESARAVRDWVAELHLSEVDITVTDAGGYADPADWRPVRTDQDSLALLQYTSGSTGSPKGVVVRHGHLLANAHAFGAALGWSTPPRFGGWIPMFHDMGLIMQLVPALLAGTADVLMTPPAFIRDPWSWLDAIGRYGITCSAAPNFAYDLCVRRVDPERVAELDLSGWEYAINASEPVRMATMTDFAKRFAAAGFRERSFVPLYGLAESTVFTSATADRAPQVLRVDDVALGRGEFTPARPGAPARSVVSCGAPVSAAEVRVVDPDTGAPLPPNRVGEIWLRGDSVAGGYWLNEAETARVFRATSPDDPTEFLRTGDLGVHHDGELYVIGRLKEVLIVRGRNLYPQDIEHELRARHPELGNVGAAFCVPAGGTTEGEPGPDELVVAHEARETDPERLAALAVAMKTTVAREFGVSASDIVLVPPGGVPRTSSGKIQRSLMRERYLARGDSGEGA